LQFCSSAWPAWPFVVRRVVFVLHSGAVA